MYSIYLVGVIENTYQMTLLKLNDNDPNNIMIFLHVIYTLYIVGFLKDFV